MEKTTAMEVVKAVETMLKYKIETCELTGDLKGNIALTDALIEVLEIKGELIKEGSLY